MLPLDVVSRDGTVTNVRAMEVGLQALKAIGVDGMSPDISKLIAVGLSLVAVRL